MVQTTRKKSIKSNNGLCDMYKLQIKTTPLPSINNVQRIVYYPSIQHIGIVAAFTDGKNTESFRMLFDILKKKVVDSEILNIQDLFGANSFAAMLHAEQLLDSKYCEIVYNRYESTIPAMQMTNLLVQPWKFTYPYQCLQTFEPKLYISIHRNKDLKKFGL